MTERNEGGDPKEKADVPPVLPSEQRSTADSAGALSPDELDFTESPYVDEISDGRYVVSADRRPNVPEKQDVSAVQPGPQEPPSDRSQSHSESRSGSPATGDTRSGPESESESESDAATEGDTPPEPGADATPEADAADRNRTTDPAGARGSVPRSPEAARSLLAAELEYPDTRFAIDIVSRFDDDTVRHRMTSDDVVGTFNSLVFWYARHVSGKTPTNRAASLLLAKSDFTPPLSESQLRQAMRTHGLDESSQLGELLEAVEQQ